MLSKKSFSLVDFKPRLNSKCQRSTNILARHPIPLAINTREKPCMCYPPAIVFAFKYRPTLYGHILSIVKQPSKFQRSCHRTGLTGLNRKYLDSKSVAKVETIFQLTKFFCFFPNFLTVRRPKEPLFRVNATDLRPKKTKTMIDSRQKNSGYQFCFASIDTQSCVA